MHPNQGRKDAAVEGLVANSIEFAALVGGVASCSSMQPDSPMRPDALVALTREEFFRA